MIATNTNGSHDLAWNGLANAVIGTAYIQDAAISNAKISEVFADKIRTGTITSQKITLDSGGVLLSSGAGTSGTSGTGFFIEGGSSPRFAIGDLAGTTSGYLRFEGSTLTVKGTIEATAGTFGASLGTSVAQGILIDADGLLVKSTTGNGRIAANINWTTAGGGSFTPTSTSGFYLGGYNGTYRFFIGNTGTLGLGVGANSLYWNGSSLAINGSLTGTIQSGTQLGSSGDVVGGLIINSPVGIRTANSNQTLTITGGTGNGNTNGAQIDFGGNGLADGNRGILILQGGAVGDSLDNGRIEFRTNSSSTANVGVIRASIRTNGEFIVYKNASSGGTYTSGSGCGQFNGNLSVGRNFDPVDSSGNTTGKLWVATEVAVYSGSTRNIVLTGSSGDVTADQFTTNSSKRLKKNIKKLKNGISLIKNLNPVSYTKKKEKNKKEIGLIAEEVNEFLPEIVKKDVNNNPEGIDYSRLTVVLVNAVKELSLEIEALKKKIKYNADPNKL
jgi:hypothetical protein